MNAPCDRSMAKLSLAGLVSLALCGTAAAQTAPNLGSTAPYGIVSSTFTNSNTGTQTLVDGDVCYTTGPTTPPVTITGTTRTPCPPQTGIDQGLALSTLNGQLCTSLGAGAVALDSVVIGANPPGTIPPGCYTSGGAMSVTVSTTVTLSGGGVYIFRPGGALDTGANSRVIVTGGACASDVYWAPVGATTLGANAAPSPTPTFVGNILDAAGITIGHFANLNGRAIAFGGTVTVDAATITVPTCGTGLAQPTITTQASPSVAVGGFIRDTATLAGGAAPTGSITFRLFGPEDATCTGTAVFTSTVPVNGNGSYTSADFAPTAAGTYRWIARYGGDGANLPVAGACNAPNESVQVVLSAAAPTAVPTLSGWTLMLLAALLAITGFVRSRRPAR